MSGSSFLGSGDLYIDRLTVAGATSGYQDPVNAQMLQIEEKTEILKTISRMRDTRGQTLDTVANKQPATIKITLEQVDRDKLAMALLGSVAALTQAGATVASGAATVVTLIPGKWVPISTHKNITAHVAVTSPITIATTASTPVAVPLDDVVFNLREGLVKYIGTSLTVPTEVTMTYKYGSESGYRISGSSQPTIKARLLLDGVNAVDGSRVRVLIDEAVMTPSAPVDFLSDKFVTLELTGELRTLTGKSAPYTVELFDA